MYLSHKTTRRILEASFGLGTAPLGDFKDASATPTANITPVSVALMKQTVVTASDLRTGVIPPGAEPAPAGYSRVALTTASYTAPLITDYPGRNSFATSSGTTIAFTKLNAADDWGTIGWVVLFDATPSVVWAAPIGPVNMGPNQVSGLTISPGNLALQFHPVAEPTWGAEQKWRLLNAIAKGIYVTVTPFNPEYTLWSGNQVMHGGGIVNPYFDSPGVVPNVRAITLGIYKDYDDSWNGLTTSLTANHTGCLVEPAALEFNGYNPTAVPSLVDAPSAGHQPLVLEFVSAAGVGSTTNYVQNRYEIKFPQAVAAWNLPSTAVLAVVNWRYNQPTTTWIKQRVLAVVPASSWVIPLGNQLTIPAGGLKLRAD